MVMDGSACSFTMGSEDEWLRAAVSGSDLCRAVDFSGS